MRWTWLWTWWEDKQCEWRKFRCGSWLSRGRLKTMGVESGWVWQWQLCGLWLPWMTKIKCYILIKHIQHFRKSKMLNGFHDSSCFPLYLSLSPMITMIIIHSTWVLDKCFLVWNKATGIEQDIRDDSLAPLQGVHTWQDHSSVLRSYG
jgi:hypothetical protein